MIYALTERKLEAAKAKAKPYKLADGGALCPGLHHRNQVVAL